MEYQKIINLLNDTTNQPSKFRSGNCVETNDESQRTCGDDNNNNDGNNNNIKFKASMIRWILGDFSDAHILVKETIIVLNTAAASAAVNNTNKRIVFKNWAPFTSFITKINNTQVDYAEDFDTVMPMFNLIECRITYLKASRRLWQYYRDEPTIEANNNIIDFPANKFNSNSFKFKQGKQKNVAQKLLK